jgi:hypothetical protein
MRQVSGALASAMGHDRQPSYTTLGSPPHPHGHAHGPPTLSPRASANEGGGGGGGPEVLSGLDNTPQLPPGMSAGGGSTGGGGGGGGGGASAGAPGGASGLPPDRTMYIRCYSHALLLRESPALSDDVDAILAPLRLKRWALLS